jgi:hypothetical protein
MILEIALAVTLRDIGWLAGEWQIASPARCVEEQGTAASSNMLVGMSRTVEGGRTKSFEFMRIEARADGIYYVAQPGDGPRWTSSSRRNRRPSSCSSTRATSIV